jgi:hypothetical protein
VWEKTMRGVFARVLMACAVIAASAAAANAQGSWTKKAPMPAALNEVALAGVGTKIHVIGGGVLGVAGPYHQEYDTEKDSGARVRCCRRASTTSAQRFSTARFIRSAGSSAPFTAMARTRPMNTIRRPTPGAFLR